MWLGSFMSCSLFLVSSVLVGRECVHSNFQNLVFIIKPVYSKCFGNICKPKEIDFTAQSPCVFASINDELIYRRIFTDPTENLFQAFGHGKCTKRLHISKSLSSHQLQGVNTHPENSACHSKQISKPRQTIFTFTDAKALLHIVNIAFVTV